jgi:tetratricopeptide (TPR) repeat protein
MTQPRTNDQPKASPPGPGRVLAFKVIGVSLPFVFLVLVEVLLRVFHYGYATDLFMEYSGNKDLLVMNPDASKKYFTNASAATVGNVEFFRKVKNKNTLRIFVLGESTTLGYPYFHNGSFHRWLQYRLQHTFPERDFEIINLALTAVNSYTVMGFAKEVVNYSPDAVFIYTGHNEYYGTLGVASTDRIGGSRFVVKTMLLLRELKMVQGMTRMYEKLFSPSSQTSGGTRMKRMVADERIPFGSERYRRGMEQFKANLAETLKVFEQHNIPVFVSTLVSNERDLKPFVSFQVDSVKHPGFRESFASAVKALRDNDLSLAYRYLKKADAIYDGHALCQYYLGRLAYRYGDYEKAKHAFQRAKDFDGLRFRAPEEANDIIRQTCREHSNARVVETKAFFERTSPHGVTGDALILEHVHPNLTGYGLLSDAFYEALKNENIIVADPQKEITVEQLLRVMPITKVDSLSGLYKIDRLKRNWPFREALHRDSVKVETYEEVLALKLANRQVTWQVATDSLYTYYLSNRNFRSAKTVMETLVLEYPEDAALYEKAAMLSGEVNALADALVYFQNAFRRAPTTEKARYLFVLYLKQDRPTEAMPYLDYVMAHSPSRAALLPVKTYAEKIIKLQTVQKKDTANVTLLNEIAQAYYRMDNRDATEKYIRKIFKLDTHNATALALQAKLNHK